MNKGWKAFAPESWRTWWRQHFGWRWFRGDYATWAEARVHANAGDGSADFARVCAAARAVRLGSAVWDRDGVTFLEPLTHTPLLTALQVSAQAHGGRLEIVDFGGGLGSTWWQHRVALAGLDCRSWRVVERPQLVAVGRDEFTVGPVSFYASLVEAAVAGPATTILLSSVLSYLEDPYALLTNVISLGVDDVIVDRTPFVVGTRDRLVVQQTPPELGGGSHPCRLFIRENLLGLFAARYELVDEWPVPFDRIDSAVDYRGLHFRLRTAATIL